MGRVGTQDFFKIPDHRVGVEIRSIMEFDAFAQGEGPFGGIVWVHTPACCKAGDQRNRFVRGGQVIRDQGFEHLIAHEAHPFGPLVGLTIGQGHVASRHGNAQCALGGGSVCKSKRQNGGNDSAPKQTRSKGAGECFGLGHLCGSCQETGMIRLQTRKHSFLKLICEIFRA